MIFLILMIKIINLGVSMSNFTGSCLCGSVNYKSNSDPLVTQNCHCDDCKKACGSVYLTNVFIKEENFEPSGNPNSFNHQSDAGNKMTGVCKKQETETCIIASCVVDGWTQILTGKNSTYPKLSQQA